MSGEINILIDEIEAIAQQTRSQIASAAQEGAGEFANATLDAGAFAGIPPGLDFHAHQATAHQVYSEILTGVVTDLENFADALAANAANHRAVDESNADSMPTVEARQADERAAAAAMSNVNDQYGNGSQLESNEVYAANYDEAVAAEGATGPADSEGIDSTPGPEPSGDSSESSGPGAGPESSSTAAEAPSSSSSEAVPPGTGGSY